MMSIESESLMKRIRQRPSRACQAVATLAAIGLSLLVGGCSGGSVARVNGDAISNQDFLNEVLKSETAAPVLNFLIADKVLEQEAKSKNVLPKQKQIDDFINDLKKKNQQNPEALKTIEKNRSEIERRVRFQLMQENLMEVGVNLTPDAQKAWFDSHHSVFDQPGTATVAVMVFDSKQKADSAENLLKNGSSPGDVASALGSPGWPENGKTSSPQSKLQMQSFYGPSMESITDKLFDPATKPGFTSDPAPGVFKTRDKFGILKLVGRTDAKPASFPDSQQQVRSFMAAADYASKNMGLKDLPTGLDLNQFQTLVQQAGQDQLKTLVKAYFEKNQITINDPQLEETIKQQYLAAPAPQGMGGQGMNGQSVPPQPPAPPSQ